MRDGSTRRIEAVDDGAPDYAAWADLWQACLVVTRGPAAGSEYPFDAPEITLGRGADATWRFDDDAMSSRHAMLAVEGGALVLRDLGSMNGTRVEGAPITATELKHGDHIELGETAFQLVLEPRERAPRTYVIDTAD